MKRVFYISISFLLLISLVQGFPFGEIINPPLQEEIINETNKTIQIEDSEFITTIITYDKINPLEDKPLFIGDREYINTSNIIANSKTEYSAEWYPDNSLKKDLKKLTIELQIEDKLTGYNVSLKGITDIPKYYGGHFDFNTSHQSIVVFNDIKPLISWQYSTSYKEVIINFTKIDTDINLDEMQTDEKEKINKEITILHTKEFYNYKTITSLEIKNLLRKQVYLDPDVTACGNLSTSDSIYTLIQNVTSNSTCFIISANNITLDGNGYMINYSMNGTLGYGVYAYKFGNITIKNTTIVEGKTTASSKHGIYLYETKNSTIANNTILIIGSSSNGINLISAASGGNYISNNNIIITSSGNGIYFEGSYGRIFNNIVNLTTDSGYRTAITIDGDYNNASLNNIIGKGCQWNGVIRIVSAKYNSFTNNNITSPNWDSFEVVSTTKEDHNNTIDSSNLVEGKPVNYTYNCNNLIFNRIDFTQYGQVIFAHCNNITIINSNFSTDALYLTHVNSSNISNNLINTNNGIGIMLNHGCNHNILNKNIIDISAGTNSSLTGIVIYSTLATIYTTNNSIGGNNILVSGSASSLAGMFPRTYVKDNIIRDNYINNTASGSNTYGINYGTSYSNELINNSIYTDKSTSTGVYTSTTIANSVFTNNTIINFGTGSSSDAWSCYTPSRNNTYIGNYFETKSSSANAFNVDAFSTVLSNNFTMFDSILITNGSGVEFEIDGIVRGDWNMTNVTRANGRPINITWGTSIYPTGKLSMHWYLDVYTNYSNGTAVPGVQINITDVYGNLQNTTTDSNGNIRVILLEYIRNNTGGYNYTVYSNYSINATLSGTTLTSQVNLSTNQYQVFTFDSGEADTEYPYFYDFWDNNASIISSGIAMFNASINRTNGTVFLQIDNVNYTASNTTLNYYNISTTLSSGTYGYYWGAWGNGSSHNYNVSALRYYTVNASADTCTYSGSGNWNLNCSDDCVFTSTTTISGGNNISIYGSGNLTFNNNGKWFFTGSRQKISMNPICRLIINSGGGII